MMGIIALVIVLDSPGSPFFIQERVGKDGRRFRLYKFRTMRCNHDDRDDRLFMQAYVRGELNGNGTLGERDALNKPIKKGEITRAGCFLRKSSLDELPQLINIIKGEMSLVGPRPNVPWEVEHYSDWHYERLKVLPGLTGLAQIHGRSSISFDEIAEYDLQYVQNANFRMDMAILLGTVRSVFSANGAG